MSTEVSSKKRPIEESDDVEADTNNNHSTDDNLELNAKKRSAIDDRVGTAGDLKSNEASFIAPTQVLSERRVANVCSIDTVHSNSSLETSSASIPPSASSEGGGFLAYSKVNPFAATMENSNSNSFPVPTKNPFSAAFSKPISTTNIVSPKSPKPNPFSSQSPVHNPFVSFEDKTDGYWSILAKGKDQYLKDINQAYSLSAPSSFSTHSANTSISTTHNSNSFTSDPATTSTNNSFMSYKDSKASYAFNSSFDVKSNSNSIFATANKPLFSTSSDKGKSDKESESVAKKDDEEEEDNDDTADNDEEVNDERNGDAPLFSSADNKDSVENGEKDEECLVQVRAKLYRLTHKKTEDSKKLDVDASDNTPSESTIKSLAEWVEMGIGPVRILQCTNPGESLAPTEKQADGEVQSNDDSITRPNSDIEVGVKAAEKVVSRLVMRRENQPGGLGTKLLINVLLRGHVSIAKQGDHAVRLSCISTNTDSTVAPVSYLLKTKHSHETDQLFDTIDNILKGTSN